jgi:hypothetical protein
LCLFLLAGAIAFCVSCWRAIHTPVELDYAEGIVLWQAERIGHLATVYRSIDRYPYISCVYPPVYQFAAAFVKQFTGDMLAAGRSVSFLSALGICLVVGLEAWWAIPRRAGVFLRISCSLVAGMLCANLDTMQWARLMRIDMLALLFTFTGMYLFTRSPRWALGQYLAVALFVAALFTRQTMLAAPVACLLLALLIKPAQALRLLALAILLGASGMIALIVPTHGLVVTNLFGYIKNPFSIVNMFGILQVNLAVMTPLAAIALAVPIAVWRRLSRGHGSSFVDGARRWIAGSDLRRALALAALHLTLALLTSLSCGKRGSNINYFLEWNIACCLPVALVLAWTLSRWRTDRLPLAQTAVLLLLVLQATKGAGALGWILLRPPPAVPGEQLENEAAIRAIRAIPGRIYSEPMLLVMQAGKELEAEADIITPLAQTGRFDETGLVNRFNSHEYGAVIVSTSLDNRNRFSPGVSAAVQSSYTFDRRIGRYAFYIPKH